MSNLSSRLSMNPLLTIVYGLMPLRRLNIFENYLNTIHDLCMNKHRSKYYVYILIIEFISFYSFISLFIAFFTIPKRYPYLNPVFGDYTKVYGYENRYLFLFLYV